MIEQATRRRPAQRWLLPRYLVTALAARTADEGARVSLVLLALRETGSAALGGALIAALLVPHVVAAPLVGLLLDRTHHPRAVLAVLVLIFAAGLLSVALLLGHAPLWLVLVLLLVGGSCGPAITGGLTSQLPGLVGADRAPRAFGLDSLFYNVAGMAGPALAGITAAAVSPAAAQILLGTCAALGAAGVATLPIRSPSGPAEPALVGAHRPGLLSGVREILQQPILRLVTLTSAVGQLGPGALPVVAAVLATSLHRPAGSGLLLTTVAAGSLVGSLLWTWHPLAAERAPLVTALSMIGVGAPIAFAAATTSLPVTAVLFGVSGVFVGPFAAALFITRTRFAAEHLRTQVFTIGAGLKTTTAAAGSALVGLVTGLPVWALLLLVAGSPLLAGVLGTLLLAWRGSTPAPAPARVSAPVDVG